MTRYQGPCPLVWACATTSTLDICYGHYHNCSMSRGHAGNCQSGTGPEHTSAMRHGDVQTSVTAVYALIESLSGGRRRPSWLDDHRARELATFRARFTDAQWSAFKRGCCSHLTLTGEGGQLMCLDGRRHGRVLCDRHTREYRQAEGTEFNPMTTSVPSSVLAQDISEVP